MEEVELEEEDEEEYEEDFTEMPSGLFQVRAWKSSLLLTKISFLVLSQNLMKYFQCNEPKCNKLPMSSRRIGQHMKAYHSDPKLTCADCGLKFVYKSFLDQHSTTHTAAGCPMCGKIMNSRSFFISISTLLSNILNILNIIYIYLHPGLGLLEDTSGVLYTMENWAEGSVLPSVETAQNPGLE